MLAVQTEVDGRGEGDEAVVGADVRSRPLAADALLARRQRQHVAAPAGIVARLADQLPRHAADVPQARREQPTPGPP
ncbi:MAG: hypothetical protein U0802_13215 [Candidatus Binatia bacterium]